MAYGGAGLDNQTQVVAVEEMSCYCHIMGLCISQASGLVGSSVLQHSTEGQKQKYFTPLARGEVFCRSWCYRATLGDRCGSDGNDMQTHGKRLYLEWCQSVNGMRFVSPAFCPCVLPLHRRSASPVASEASRGSCKGTPNQPGVISGGCRKFVRIRGPKSFQPGLPSRAWHQPRCVAPRKPCARGYN